MDTLFKVKSEPAQQPAATVDPDNNASDLGPDPASVSLTKGQLHS